MFRMYARKNSTEQWQGMGSVNLAGIQEMTRTLTSAGFQVCLRSEIEGVDYVTEGENVRYL